MKLVNMVVVLILMTIGLVETAVSEPRPIIGLITKTNMNPFFVKMREGAETQANKLGLELRTFAGKYDGDNGAQVEAIESLIAAGAKGILITPSDSVAIVPTIKKARAAGILVVALDTLLEPASVADVTFATDNFKAGQLVGLWAARKLGDKSDQAKIALLDISAKQVSVEVARNQGFLKGFGIDLGDPEVIGDEDDPRIVGNDSTMGAEEGGRRAMENLLQRDPGINLVYTINEPAAAGAYEALKTFGLVDKVVIVSIDGGCPGVRNVAGGALNATSMQFPLRMAQLGVKAIADYIKTGKRPKLKAGQNFIDTGVELVTDDPMAGLVSIDSKQALGRCWG